MFSNYMKKNIYKFLGSYRAKAEPARFTGKRLRQEGAEKRPSQGWPLKEYINGWSESAH
ncbi:hypothetical protein TUM17379_00840 [Shewanella algae]|uniref:Uncharacterized protein n=1 Tax=Shewanella algae TaxID=38313 RepID=A0AAD1NL87_9GAMM|nr:hypothetical protein TUM17379_00840 [Shewanella algae]